MAALLHTYENGQESFDGWVFPEEFRAKTIYKASVPMGRLVLIHCFDDDSFTHVYERSVPQELLQDEESENEQWQNFAEELNPVRDRTAIIMPNLYHVTSVGDETGEFKLKIRHMPNIAQDVYMPDRTAGDILWP